LGRPRRHRRQPHQHRTSNRGPIGTVAGPATLPHPPAPPATPAGFLLS
jgi:hypothetical protein